MSAVTKAGAESLREWMGRGNVVIGLGGGGIWFTEKDASFTTATIVGADDKTDDKLKDIKPDNKSKEDKTEDKKEGKPGDKAKPKKPIALPGSIFRALWVGLRKMFFSGILFAPTRSPLSEPGE